MRTITIDTFRLVAVILWVAGVAALGVGLALDAGHNWAWVGLGMFAAAIIAELESVAQRLMSREDAAFELGRQVSHLPRQRMNGERLHSSDY